MNNTKSTEAPEVSDRTVCKIVHILEDGTEHPIQWFTNWPDAYQALDSQHPGDSRYRVIENRGGFRGSSW
jgi:hypothetical protein